MIRANQLSGAIFTTLVDGSRVNANLYAAKEDVYLDGGPGPNAPASAAGLPAGDYYFQVTDPSGKDLLSSDHISCRMLRIGDEGTIEAAYPGTNYLWKAGKWQATACEHATGADLDHSAVTVQLFPYDDTPNNGGVYKVWLTPVSEYAGNPSFVPTKHGDLVNGELWQPGNAHGFVPAASKTDNFKVKKGKPCAPQLLTVKKFHDANMNTVFDAGEPEVTGWGVAVTDPLGGGNDYFTRATVLASAGLWTVEESQPAGTLETASYLDGTKLTGYPTANPLVSVTFGTTCGESHEVAYGDVGLGEVKVCKVYDQNGDGIGGATEPPVPGFAMVLTGTTVTGANVGPTEQTTGADGCTTFANLVPGTYTVTERIPTTGSWVGVGSTSAEVTINSSLVGSELVGTKALVSFVNRCVGHANFDTKGYWHNKNGLQEITGADVAYVNGLDPYDGASDYFGAGDEPFNGSFTDGTPVVAANGEWGETLAPAGSTLAEISHFLVDSNATGDPREQLAQQLLAFIFNTRHRLDGPNAAIQLPDGTFVSAATLVEQAIAAWASGDAAQQHAMASLLDLMNNDDDVPFLYFTPCAVTYP